MFAFAILDTKARRIFLARDFFGIKPLYYTFCQNGFAFASEIKALLELPEVSHQANPQRLYDYLRYGLTDYGVETLFSNIYQLPAAHYLELSLDFPTEITPIRYWQIDLNQRQEISYTQAVQKLRELFLDNIRLHLRSDVPIGAALSGGIDSSSIVMAMRHLEPNLELHSFSYTADDPKVNEEAWIDIINRSAKNVVHKVKATPQELTQDLEHLGVLAFMLNTEYFV
jgi:asparagine synthase (glutamine-hydrolysing)